MAPSALQRSCRTPIRTPRVLIVALCLAFSFSGPSRTSESAPPDAAQGAERGTLRVALPARPGPHSLYSPLVYWGGFQTKSAVYEPLARFDAQGRLEPALLAGWDTSPDGRVYTLRLRPGVTCHDGAPLGAPDVRDHLERWRGTPGNRWLGSTERMQSIEVLDALTLRVTLREPWCFLEEAAIVNPGFVVAAGAYDHEGTFRTSVGTGPYRVLEADAERGATFVAHDGWWCGKPGLARIEMTRLTREDAESGAALERVLAGELDLLADGEAPIVPRERIAALQADPRVKVWVGAGHGTTVLVLNTRRAPFSDRAARRRLAAAIDREAWVREGELGFAAPATTLFPPGWAGWPSTRAAGGAISAVPHAADAAPTPVTLLLPSAPDARTARHLAVLERQLAVAGFGLRVEHVTDGEALAQARREGAFDLALRTTHGRPYDPYVMLQSLFLPRPVGRTAASSPLTWEDARIVEQVAAALSARDPRERERRFSAIQALLDEEVPLVPLFVHQRVAVSARDVEGLSIGADAFDLGLGGARVGLRPATPPPTRVPSSDARESPATPAPPALSTGPAKAPDPRDGEVPLPSTGGWNATLVLDNAGVGVWTVRSFDVWPMLGCPDVVGLDDKGRLHVLTSYSGKWTPTTLLNDGKWLGGVEHIDLDPRLPGPELYTGGERGLLHQLVAHPQGVLDARFVAETPGRAINILVGGDLDPAVPGPELYGFAWPGGLWRFLPPEGDAPGLRAEALPTTSPRVRDALFLPGGAGVAPEVLCVSRDGLLQSLRVAEGRATWTTLHRESMGMGRLALRPRAGPSEPFVIYTTLDDGRILRHERSGGAGGAAEGRWTTETIYLGPQGPRGIAAGRFDPDPAVETLAVFGYSTRVELLSRRADGAWTRETIFEDKDKGHWLAAAELDGRNGTDELLASGFGGRIVLLARPPGSGRAGLVGGAR